DVALDPGKRVLLADCDQHIVAREVLLRLAGRNELAPAFGVVLGLHLLEDDAGELAVFVREFLRHEEIMDRDALVHGVFLFPRRRLHFFEAGAHHHVDVLAAEPAGGPTAIHGCVATAKHHDPFTDLVDVAERDGREPVDADMDILDSFLEAADADLKAIHGCVATAKHHDPFTDLVDVAERDGREPVDADMDILDRFLAAGNVEITPPRRAGEHGARRPAFSE